MLYDQERTESRKRVEKGGTLVEVVMSGKVQVESQFKESSFGRDGKVGVQFGVTGQDIGIL